MNEEERKKFYDVLKKVEAAIDHKIASCTWYAIIEEMIREGKTDDEIVKRNKDLYDKFQSEEFRRSFWSGPMGSILAEAAGH